MLENYSFNFQTEHLFVVNGAPKTGVLKNGLITLWKITLSDARNSQQIDR